MTHRYDDMIDLPRPVSLTHAPMPQRERAAQFSPFAALTGYGEIIRETARETERKRIPDEQRKSELDRCFSVLKSREGSSPEVCVTFYVPDERKRGGEYVTVTAKIRKVDDVNGKLLLYGGKTIEMSNIWEIESDAFDGFGGEKVETSFNFPY